MKPAVVLLSGGLDSATTLAIAQSQGFEPFALSFDYGQRHRHELDAADAICRGRAITHHVQARIDLRAFGGSALTSDEHEVPKDRGQYEMNHGIPITYVPARNTVFLSFALAWAETLHAFDIFIGVNAVDYSGYPDCRPEFLHAFERLANLGTKVGVEGAGKFTVHAPLMHLHKYEIIQRGMELGVDYSLTRSCYDPDSQGRACGHCDACLLRLEGFKLAGARDPAPYVPAIADPR